MFSITKATVFCFIVWLFAAPLAFAGSHIAVDCHIANENYIDNEESFIVLPTTEIATQNRSPIPLYVTDSIALYFDKNIVITTTGETPWVSAFTVSVIPKSGPELSLRSSQRTSINNEMHSHFSLVNTTTQGTLTVECYGE